MEASVMKAQMEKNKEKVVITMIIDGIIGNNTSHIFNGHWLRLGNVVESRHAKPPNGPLCPLLMARPMVTLNPNVDSSPCRGKMHIP